MSESAVPPGLSTPVAAPQKRIFNTGTLRYTTFGLIMVFTWLLWGDFIWTLLDGCLPGILPLKLKDLGASDMTMVILNRTLAYAIVVVFAPMVSFKSDRTRSRWGRRIPYLFWSTPFVGLFLVLIGCYDELTHLCIGDAERVMFLGFTFTRTAVTLFVFAVLLVGFDFANIFVNTVYWYFFNDVVPSKFLSRFLSLFRMAGILAGMAYNYWIFPISLSHFKIVFIVGGIGYVAGFMLMCIFVKEGKYPPVPENVDRRKGLVSSIKTFFKECFTHRFYWYFFLTSTCFFLSWQSSVFSIIRNRDSLQLDLKQLGMLGVYTAPISFLMQYPAGWIADKYNPIRVYFFATLVCFLTNFVQCVWLFKDFTPHGNLVIMYFLSLAFMPFSAVQGAAELPMFMRVLPKDRFGQFCAANAMLRSGAMLVGSVFVGIFFEYLATVPAGSYLSATGSISVEATWKSDWTEEKAGPWVMNWTDSKEKNASVTVPGATAVKVYFSEIDPGSSRDQLAADADNGLSLWNAPAKGAWSRVKTGDSIGIVQKSDVPSTGHCAITKVAWQGKKTGEIQFPGDAAASFRVSGRVVDKDSGKGVPKATVSFIPEERRGKVPSVETDDNGCWSQCGLANGIGYSIELSKIQDGGTWAFDPPRRATLGALCGDNITATWKPTWTEEAVEPRAVSYDSDLGLEGTVVVPGATRVKVFFSEISLDARGCDNLTTNAKKPDCWRAPRCTNAWSGEKPGDNITLRRVAGVPSTGYFIVQKVSYVGVKTGPIRWVGRMFDAPVPFALAGRYASSPDGAGVKGVTVSFHRVGWFRQLFFSAPAPVATDDNGCWTQSGFEPGTQYAVSAEKKQEGGKWVLSETSRPYLGATRGISGDAAWISPSEWTEVPVGPWLVNYGPGQDLKGTIAVPGATAVMVYFDSYLPEPGVDRIETDATPAGDWSEERYDVYSNVKLGDNITVRLRSGDKGKGSFTVSKVLYKGRRTGPVVESGPLWGYFLSGRVTLKSDSDAGVAGVAVSFERVTGNGFVPAGVTTNDKGEWRQNGFVVGSTYRVATCKTERDGVWQFGGANWGDWRYRWYPVWTLFFQCFAVFFLILVYREWKKLGGADNYVPPAA